MKSAIAILAILSSVAHADTWLVANTASHHFTAEKFNERNLGLGIERDGGSNVTYAAGFYDNSIGRHSNYLAVSYTPAALGNLHLGIFAGLATGYQGSSVSPFGGVMGKVEWEKLGVNLLVTPKTNYSPTTAAIQMKWKFN